jgi:4'-phosphopantetheinyl transferase EntD
VSIRRLLPAHVAVRECRIADVSGDLPPVERAHVASAIEARKREFLAGRVCARAALEELRIHVDGLAAQPDRQPAWPPGIVGSITHSETHCAAAVASAATLGGIGIDIEEVERCEAEILPIICTARELAALNRLPHPRRTHVGALIFSAKEAFYKCQFPVTGAWLNFHDVEVHIASSSTLRFTCLREGRQPVDTALFHGRYAVNATTVATAVVLRHSQSSRS